MLESVFIIIISGITTFFANYLSNKETRGLSDRAKWYIARSLIFISLSSIAILALYSTVLILFGIMGLGGIHGWEFRLYDISGHTVSISGLSFEDIFEPILFIVRGAIYACVSFFLKKFAIPRLRKIQEPKTNQ